MSDVSGPAALAQAESALVASITEAVSETQPTIPELGIQPVGTPTEPVQVQPEQTATPVVEPVVQPEVPSEGIKPEAVAALPDTPEFKKALEIYGGDLNRAAQGFLETNTRNAQMAAKLREAGIDPKTLTPYPKPVEVPTVEQTLQAPDQAQVEGYVKDILGRDAVYGELVNQWQGFEAQKTQVTAALDALATQRQRAQFLIEEPSVIADSFRKEELAQQLREFDLKEVTLQNREMYLSGKQQELNNRASRRSQAAYESVTSSLQKQIEEQAFEQQSATIRAEAEAEWSTAFPVALDMSMKQFNLPTEMAPKLAERVRAYGLMHDGPIENIHGFVQSVAKGMHEEMDSFHRLKASEYAKAATVRSGLPVSTAPTVAAAASPQKFNMAEHEAQLAAQIGEGLKGYSF
jgi:hypothetical protein